MSRDQTVAPSIRQLLSGAKFLMECTLTRNGHSMKFNALIDSGAPSLFIKQSLAVKLAHRLGATISNSEDVAFITGYEGKSQNEISQTVCFGFTIAGKYFPNQHFILSDTMQQDIIVGTSFMIEHDLLADPKFCTLISRSEIIRGPPPPLKISEYVAIPPVELPRDVLDELPPSAQHMSDIEHRAKLWEIEEEREKAKKRAIQLARLRDFESHPRSYTQNHQHSLNTMQVELLRQDDVKEHVLHNKARKTLFVEHNIDICEINANAFAVNLRNKDNELGSISIYEIDQRLADLRSLDDDDEELERVELVYRLPPKLQDLADAFSKINADKLPPRRDYDHKIEITENAEPLRTAPLYKMSEAELEALKAYLVENLKKGFIESSSAPFASPVLFVKKKGGALRLCIDFRKLNLITKKDKYPLPLLDEVLSRMTRAKIFTKLDIRAAFNRIRMAEDSEELTSFRTRYGQFKCKVLPFGLCNGPATYQRYMNDVLFEYLDSFCTAYLDDIIIFSESEAEHDIHVRLVIEKLMAAGLQIDIKKCEFGVKETKFLGFVLTTDGLKVDQEKIAVIKDWGYAKTKREIQSYLGFCNFYRRFIKDYSKICMPLNRLTNKGVVFDFNDECKQAWETIRTALCSAPILHHFQTDYETMIETDASDGVVSGVLSQRQKDDLWHPVAYYTKTMKKAENNYPIHDKEMLAIVRAFEQWRAELEGASRPTLVYSDHEALEYFMTTKKLSGRQARWAELLARYHFEIKYRPGRENTLADILSRRGQEVAVSKEERDQERHQVLLPQHQTDPLIVAEREKKLAADTAALLEKSKSEPLLVLKREERLQAERGRPPAKVHEIHAILYPQQAKYSIHNNTFTQKYLHVDVNELEPMFPARASHFSLLDKIVQKNREEPSIQNLRDQVHESGDFSIMDGLLYVKNRLFIPEGEFEGVPFYTALIKEVHSQPSAAHPGVRKMTQILQQRFWWPKMTKHIEQYVTNCHECRRARVPRDKSPGLLHPLPVPDHVWQHAVMDFKYMPTDEDGHDAILVFMDRLGKRPISIPCMRTCTARELANLFLIHIYRHYGAPDSMVSDRGTQFVSDFWNEVCYILQVKMNLSTAHSHQTAGQVEVMNQYIDQRLRPFVNFYQKNWSKLLPMVDFAAAALPSEATGQSSFKTEMNYEPRWSFDYRQIDKKLSPTEKLNRQEAQDLMKGLEEARDKARSFMQKTHERYESQANKKRREPDFTVGDSVWVSTEDWKTDRPSKKLSAKMAGPFKILEEKDYNYLLELPATFKVHPWFHARKLRLDPQNPLPGQHNEPPPPEEVNGEDEWEVEAILGCRQVGQKLKYRIQWVGHDVDLTEYDAWQLANSPIMLRDFHLAHPELPGPPKFLHYWLDCAEKETFPEEKKGHNAPMTKKERAVRFSATVEVIG